MVHAYKLTSLASNTLAWVFMFTFDSIIAQIGSPSEHHALQEVTFNGSHASLSAARAILRHGRLNSKQLNQEQTELKNHVQCCVHQRMRATSCSHMLSNSEIQVLVPDCSRLWSGLGARVLKVLLSLMNVTKPRTALQSRSKAAVANRVKARPPG